MAVAICLPTAKAVDLFCIEPGQHRQDGKRDTSATDVGALYSLPDALTESCGASCAACGGQVRAASTVLPDQSRESSCRCACASLRGGATCFPMPLSELPL